MGPAALDWEEGQSRPPNAWGLDLRLQKTRQAERTSLDNRRTPSKAVGSEKHGMSVQKSSFGRGYWARQQTACVLRKRTVSFRR